MNKLEIKDNMFENIRHIDENGLEYWLARDLQLVLGYRQWRRFERVINNAMIACKNSNYNVSDYFANVGKIVSTGVAYKKIQDYKLSRYACYLIAQNGDSRKKTIALAQTYFAIKTREMEILESDYNLLT